MPLAAFLTIVAIHLAAAMSPGPSFVVAVRTAVAEGFGVATALSLGLGLGAVIWAGAALSGLALLFEVAPSALLAMKLAGAGALIWIAWQTFRHRADPIAAPGFGAAPRRPAAAIRLGLVTQLSNPKPAVFFGAVFVGLVPPGASPLSLALLLAVMLVNETLWYALVARIFSLPRPRAFYSGLKHRIDTVFAGLIAALGLRIAIT